MQGRSYPPTSNLDVGDSMAQDSCGVPQMSSFVDKQHVEAMDVDLPGLVNVYKKLWKDPPFSLGKSTINDHVQ
jgi:hypothetical protein